MQKLNDLKFSLNSDSTPINRLMHDVKAPIKNADQNVFVKQCKDILSKLDKKKIKRGIHPWR